MPITYGSSLEEFTNSKHRIGVPQQADLDLQSMSNTIDEKFRAYGKNSCHYVNRLFDIKSGFVYQNFEGIAESSAGYEYMWGYNHPAWRRLHNLLPGIDIGGPWIKYDINIVNLGQEMKAYFQVSGNAWQIYSGLLCASQEVATLAAHTQAEALSNNLIWIRGLTPVLLNADVMNALGATAISRVEPTNPASDLSTALGELYRDGLPSLPGRQDGNLGSEYLNMQFGWAPTISDGSDFINSIRNFDSIKDQYVRDSGRLVRRTYDFGITETSSVSTAANQAPISLSGIGPTGQQMQTGTLTTTVRTVTHRWFSGAFTYYLPADAFLRNIQILDKAYGINPGLDTAWELTPWSWLFDWFSNAGDVIHNLNAFTQGGLTMPWGYVMSDTTVYTEYSLDCAYRDSGNNWRPVTLFSAVNKRTRQRQRANPFGFGLTWDGLSSFQLSILAALGLSRGRLAW